MTSQTPVTNVTGRAPGADDILESESENEMYDEPKRVVRPRRNGVCAEPYVQGYFKEPYWNKHESWERKLKRVLRPRQVFAHLDDFELNKLVRSMSTHLYLSGDCIAHQGEEGDALLVVLEGAVDSYFDVLSNTRRNTPGNERELKEHEFRDRMHVSRHEVGAIFDEIMIIWSMPRPVSHIARGEQCILAKLSRPDFTNLVVRSTVYKWWGRQDYLRKVPLFEMMADEQIAKLVDCMKITTVEPNQNIIKQGDYGEIFYVLDEGEARVWKQVGRDDEQEYIRYTGGELFGELALLKNTTRAANVTSVSRCRLLFLSKRQFERLHGPMGLLQQQQYLTDPRKLIGDFYCPGDTRGAAGTLKQQGLEADASRPKSNWFAVYRPTSRDAIAKMLSGAAVGKGLNVKGKSAKQGVLSGYVPFCQISDNKHKALIEQSPKNARLLIYYKSKNNREEARKRLEAVMASMDARSVAERRIDLVEDFAPKNFGLDVPEPVMKEAYIMASDISPVMGWETGRRSEPAFMDMNLHAIRETSEPKVVLFQNDEADAMNPRGLLIAYAEKFVKPVVSDFDTFLIASKGMEYEPLPDEQAKLVLWTLEHTEAILQTPDHNPWTVRWLEVLKKENERGFHPKFPKYGFGDPTSYKFIGDIVNETADCGAIRHGAECFNFYFPQELDDEFLVVWEGFPEKPWAYRKEAPLRDFLAERLVDGYAFPLNPVWPVRDQGWYDIFQTILNTPDEMCQKANRSWYPSRMGILERIKEIHVRCPNGFVQSADAAEAQRVERRASEQNKKESVTPGKDGTKAELDPNAPYVDDRSKGISGRILHNFSKAGSYFSMLSRSRKKKPTTDENAQANNAK